MAESPLRVVTDSDVPVPRPRRQTVKAAAASGSRRELLVALRDRLAADLDKRTTAPRDMASLSRRLLEVAKELEAFEAASSKDAVRVASSTPDEAWVAR